MNISITIDDKRHKKFRSFDIAAKWLSQYTDMGEEQAWESFQRWHQNGGFYGRTPNGGNLLEVVFNNIR